MSGLPLRDILSSVSILSYGKKYPHAHAVGSNPYMASSCNSGI